MGQTGGQLNSNIFRLEVGEYSLIKSSEKMR